MSYVSCRSGPLNYIGIFNSAVLLDFFNNPENYKCILKNSNKLGKSLFLSVCPFYPWLSRLRALVALQTAAHVCTSISLLQSTYTFKNNMGFVEFEVCLALLSCTTTYTGISIFSTAGYFDIKEDLQDE